MNFETSCRIPADHPSLPGHFPGAPVVPGVLLLDRVLDAVSAWRGDCAVTGIPTVKFLTPLRPLQEFSIHLSAAANGRVKFECRRDGSAFARGELEISAPTRADEF